MTKPWVLGNTMKRFLIDYHYFSRFARMGWLCFVKDTLHWLWRCMLYSTAPLLWPTDMLLMLTSPLECYAQARIYLYTLFIWLKNQKDRVIIIQNFRVTFRYTYAFRLLACDCKKINRICYLTTERISNHIYQGSSPRPLPSTSLRKRI